MQRRVRLLLMLGVLAGLVGIAAAVPQSQTPRENPDRARGVAWDMGGDSCLSGRRNRALVATDISTAPICPGEPIFPPQLNEQVSCSVSHRDSEIGIRCVRVQPSRDLFCKQSVEARLDSKRDGDTWSGAGSWSVSGTGVCYPFSFRQDFVVSGRRLSSEAACAGEPSSLVQSFFPHPGLVPILAEINSDEKK